MKGPKEIVAEALSNALAEFFIIDPKSVETNLVSNAGITLKNVQLKENKIMIHEGLCATINGGVTQVSFSWSWGGDGKGSSWVKNARLSITGLTFAARLSKESIEHSEVLQNEAAGTQKPEPSASKSGIAAYIEEQVELILDSLTLSIDDFEFRIEIPSTADDNLGALVLGGTSLELKSSGRIAGDALHQTLSLGSLYSHILADNTIHLLLEKIAYKAKCTRASGKRFTELDKGLHVVGESNDEGIVIHAGAIQMGFLNELIGLVLVASKDDDEESSKPDGSVVMNSSISSLFELPLSAVSIVLPNSVKVSLSGLMIKYRFDGTMLQVEGREGFSVDNFPVLSLGETSLWCADVVRSKFTINDPTIVNAHEQDVVAFIHGRPQEIQNTMQGIDQVMQIYELRKDTGALGFIATSIEQNSTNPNIEEDERPWTASIDGMVALLWEASEKDSAEAMLRGIALDLKPTVTLRIQSIDKIFVPGLVRLLSPLEGSVLTFNGSTAHLTLGQIEAEALFVDENAANDDKDEVEGKPFSLDVGIRLTFDCLRLKKPDDSLLVDLTGLVLALSPVPPDDGDNTCIAVSVHVDDVNHEMIRLMNPNIAALIHTDNFKIIDSFALGADLITIAAGYSVLDWKSLIGKGKKSPRKTQRSVKKSQSQSLTSIRLPFARVNELKLKFAVNGVVGMNESTLHISPFKGEETTSSDDLIAYYTTKVIANTPGLISNAEVLGVGISDATVGHYGSVFGVTVMSGLGKAAGPAGGILSVAAFDGVRNTIKAGKASRGAADDDKWKASDLVRGLAYAAKQATRGGATKRGKTVNERGNIVDWTVGATSDVVGYADENKSRLGAAGAGTFGFILGAAVAGPVGGMAGAVIVSAVTGKTITTLESFGNKHSMPMKVSGTRMNELVPWEGIEYSIEDHKKSFELEEEEGENLVIDDHPPILQGVLAKRRDFFQWDWRIHFFVAEDGDLKYYSISERPPTETTALDQTEDAKLDSQHLHVDDLNGPQKRMCMTGLSIDADDAASIPNDNLFVFTIRTSGKNDSLWVLGAPSESIRAKWIAGLRYEASRKGASTGIEYHVGVIEDPENKKEQKGKDENTVKVDVTPNLHGLTGVLAKRRDFFVWDWRLHLFVLDKLELKYYHFTTTPPSEITAVQSEVTPRNSSAIYIDDTKPPRKCLHLRGLHVEANDSASKPSENLFVFALHAIGKNDTIWMLAAPTEAIRSKWIAELTEACKAATGAGQYDRSDITLR